MIALRRAQASDVPALAALAKRSRRSAFATAPEPYVRDRLSRDLESPWYARYWPTMTIAEDHGERIGLVQPMTDEINGLRVDPSAFGRGVGTRLLAAGEQEIVLAGHRRSWLKCSGFNERAAVSTRNAAMSRSKGGRPCASKASSRSC
jgi:ribosomal protein S18 acetylase RimI-like enzyme